MYKKATVDIFVIAEDIWCCVRIGQGWYQVARAVVGGGREGGREEGEGMGRVSWLKTVVQYPTGHPTFHYHCPTHCGGGWGGQVVVEGEEDRL